MQARCTNGTEQVDEEDETAQEFQSDQLSCSEHANARTGKLRPESDFRVMDYRRSAGYPGGRTFGYYYRTCMSGYGYSLINEDAYQLPDNPDA